MGAVMLPAILPTLAENVPAFVDNVVRFPLGLAGISSPAQSPLLGHLVVSLFPGIHRLFTICVAGAGMIVLIYVLVRHTPRTPAALSKLVGWVLTFAIVLAPATRLGYVLYPINFFAWSWLLSCEDKAFPLLDEVSPTPEEQADEALGAARRVEMPERSREPAAYART